jgi:hypothetical protein
MPKRVRLSCDSNPLSTTELRRGIIRAWLIRKPEFDESIEFGERTKKPYPSCLSEMV